MGIFEQKKMRNLNKENPLNNSVEYKKKFNIIWFFFTYFFCLNIKFDNNGNYKNSNGVPKKIMMESLIIKHNLNSIKRYRINSWNVKSWDPKAL